MSYRDIVYQAIVTDPQLQAMGLTASHVKQARGLDVRPSDTVFAMIRWYDEGQPPFGRVKPPRRMSVYVHVPEEKTNDFTKIDDALDRIEEVLVGLEQVEGAGGHWVTCVRYTGRSEDTKDEGLQTYYRYANFEVLYRREAA